MNGNLYAHWERRGISLHLVPWGAVQCRGLHQVFPVGYGQMGRRSAGPNA